jgi:hypothetical protein
MITERNITLTEERIAVFSDDMLYRYFLSIIWDESLPVLVGFCLNPSTATHLVNDPTVARMCRRAELLNCGGHIMLNAFGYRETDRLKMLEVEDPVGPDNDRYIRETLLQAKAKGWPVMVGWGNEGGHRGRSARMARLLDLCGVQAQCLKYCANGEPGHPLYQPYDAELKPWPRVVS